MVQKDDRLICYQNGGIYEMCGESARRIAKLDVPAWVKLAYRSRLAIRLLRCIPRAGCLSGGRLLIFAFRKTIYVVDTEEKRVKAGFPVREGFSNPLNIVPMEAGGEYIAVYGDYGANRERRHVFQRVWSRTKRRGGDSGSISPGDWEQGSKTGESRSLRYVGKRCGR